MIPLDVYQRLNPPDPLTVEWLLQVGRSRVMGYQIPEGPTNVPSRQRLMTYKAVFWHIDRRLISVREVKTERDTLTKVRVVFR